MRTFKGYKASIVFLSLGLLLLQAAVAVAALLPEGEARSLVFPVYIAQQSIPVAVVRVDRLSTEFQKRGFFHVGLFPRTVLTGVLIELDSPDRLPAALDSLQRAIQQSRKGQEWEVRSVCLVVRNNPQMLCSVGRVSPDGAKCWRVEDLSCPAPAGQVVTISSARLHADGQLELETEHPLVPFAVWLKNPNAGQSSANP